MSNNVSSRSGFSLLELFVGLALMSLIAVGLSSSFSVAVSLWKRSIAVEATGHDLFLRQHLRRWIAQAARPDVRQVPQAVQNQFVGDELGFSFATRAEFPFQTEASFHRIEVLKRDGQLVLVRLGYGDDGVELTNSSDILNDTAEDFTFSYLAKQGNELSWVSTWETESLPVLISISSVSDRSWPVFIARPLLD